MSKTQILIFTSYYKPGFKGGGPIKSVANIVGALNNDYKFNIVTLDRDLNDSSPYEGIKQNQWNNLDDGANVYYYSPDKANIKTYFQLIRNNNYNVIYLNGLYSKQTRMITILKKLKMINSNVIIAPRGEVEKGALKFKTRKKIFFLKVNKVFNVYKDIYWHATNNQEKLDINKYINTRKVFVASNISDEPSVIKTQPLKKRSGQLRCVFISRISPKKNIILALKALKNVVGNVTYDIYGPKEDVNYFKECQEIIENLPENTKVNYKGEISPELISSTFPKYHFFVFPTLGENFGHVIYEALNSKVPVITTRNVPENDLFERNIGFNLGYKEKEWSQVLQECVNMTNIDYEIIQNSLELNVKRLMEVRRASIDSTRSMFNKSI